MVSQKPKYCANIRCINSPRMQISRSKAMLVRAFRVYEKKSKKRLRILKSNSRTPYALVSIEGARCPLPKTNVDQMVS